MGCYCFKCLLASCFGSFYKTIVIRFHNHLRMFLKGTYSCMSCYVFEKVNEFRHDIFS